MIYPTFISKTREPDVEPRALRFWISYDFSKNFEGILCRRFVVGVVEKRAGKAGRVCNNVKPVILVSRNWR